MANDPASGLPVGRPMAARTPENLAPPVPGTVDDQIKLDEMALRQKTADSIVGMFKAANIWILVTMGAMFAVDVWYMDGRGLKPDDRLINRDILMALIGATTVQLGVVMVAIARYVFPTKD